MNRLGADYPQANLEALRGDPSRSIIGTLARTAFERLGQVELGDKIRHVGSVASAGFMEHARSASEGLMAHARYAGEAAVEFAQRHSPLRLG